MFIIPNRVAGGKNIGTSLLESLEHNFQWDKDIPYFIRNIRFLPETNSSPLKNGGTGRRSGFPIGSWDVVTVQGVCC